MGMEDDNDGEHTRVWWWIDAARYAVVALVTAFTVATIARAVAVTLRSEKLYLKVVNVLVSVSMVDFSPRTAKVSLIFQAYSPSSRAVIQYKDVNITFLYPNGSEITWIYIDGGVILAPSPSSVREVLVEATDLEVPSDVPLEFVWMILKEGEVRDATVRFNGTAVQTLITGLRHQRGHNTQFRCPHVNIVNVSLHRALEDVNCDEVS